MKRWAYLLILLGCSSSSTPEATAPADDAGADVSEPIDAGVDTKPAFDGSCVVASFGDKLTNGFGRIDGVITALQMPDDQACSMPNRDHLIVQVLMNGAVYRMVVNTDAFVLEIDHALPAPAFSEGWHTGVALDYPKDLGVHSPAFTDPGDMAATVTKIIGAGLAVGDNVSIYGTSEDRPESAHLVHRNPNVPNTDGAIVVHPDSASPKLVLFAFDNQTF